MQQTNRLTKELRKDTRKEGQVTRNIVCHCRRQRFNNCVNAEDTLKKLQRDERMYCYFLINQEISKAP